ncbi:TIGR02444 family protein [Zestomonas thermotolerans]|uniref:TIGR02444 family protein n=1 Tax=Zestomonas thermotolerans TaxID=157784 RepID=UPI0003703A1D|nr:TIGR02444 family protein [Pseudomonas thermotolerans]
MPSDLWSFAVHFYQREGIEEACLQLQEAGADVCLLLAGAWLGQRGVAFATERADCLRAIATPWQAEVISPLRTLRQAWRARAQTDEALGGLREQLKALELSAERQLLLRLESAAQAWPEDEARNTQLWLWGLADESGSQAPEALRRLREALGD